ncbi:hypothetical protein [Streptomyces chryseus]
MGDCFGPTALTLLFTGALTWGVGVLLAVASLAQAVTARRHRRQRRTYVRKLSAELTAREKERQLAVYLPCHSTTCAHNETLHHFVSERLVCSDCGDSEPTAIWP